MAAARRPGARRRSGSASGSRRRGPCRRPCSCSCWRRLMQVRPHCWGRWHPRPKRRASPWAVCRCDAQPAVAAALRAMERSRRGPRRFPCLPRRLDGSTWVRPLMRTVPATQACVTTVAVCFLTTTTTAMVALAPPGLPGRSERRVCLCVCSCRVPVLCVYAAAVGRVLTNVPSREGAASAERRSSSTQTDTETHTLHHTTGQRRK
jgi:hypothetical protein